MRLLPLLVLLSCDVQPRPCGAEDCAKDCDLLLPGGRLRERAPSQTDGPSPELTAAEYAAFEDALLDIRAGIRPWSDDSVGVCVGANGCVESLGPNPGVLPPGSYVVSADLRAPKAKGEFWRFVFRQRCAATHPTDPDAERELIDIEQEHPVAWVSETRPASFGALATITSPHPDKHLDCAWHLELHNPLKVELIEGTYEVPARSELTAEASPTPEATPAQTDEPPPEELNAGEDPP